MYYTLKQTHNNMYFINDIPVVRSTFDKYLYNTEKYKQIDYTCYFNSNQDFIRQWEVMEL